MAARPFSHSGRPFTATNQDDTNSRREPWRTSLSSIVATGPQRLATGFGFTEGPVWHPDGHWLFVDIPRNLIYRLAPGGIPEVFRDNSGGSNGLTFDLRGNLILCEGSNRQMTRREADGSYTPIATQIDGKHLNHPNDVAGRSDGSLYFTDPTFGMTPEEHELDFAGVHRIAPDGSVSVATRDTELPNGIAFSPTKARFTWSSAGPAIAASKRKSGAWSAAINSFGPLTSPRTAASATIGYSPACTPIRTACPTV